MQALKNWFSPKDQAQGGQVYWHPQWGEGLLHTLNGSRQIAVFPVWRNASVQYYDIGYVRRLVIKLDSTGEILSGNLLEMIGNKSYLNTYKDDIPPSFYNGSLQNTGVVAWERELEITGVNSPTSSFGSSTNVCYTTTYFNDENCTITTSATCTSPVENNLPQ